MAYTRLTDIDLHALIAGRTYHPSPTAWEDQVLYFLMVDRFSDGRENQYRDNSNQLVTTGTTPPFQTAGNGNAVATPEEAAGWRDAGTTWVGGTLKGLESKLGYLKRLGVTAIWISPIFKQVKVCHTYHGYGVQNFLDVDEQFGTGDDLKSLVATAHRLGLYVILDITLNHAGDVFAYDPDRYWMEDPTTHTRFLDPRWDGRRYPVHGYRDGSGAPSLPFTPVDSADNPGSWPDGTIWPIELQAPLHLRKRAGSATGITTRSSLRATFPILRIFIWGRPRPMRQAMTGLSDTNRPRRSTPSAISTSSGSRVPISTGFESTL